MAQARPDPVPPIPISHVQSGRRCLPWRNTQTRHAVFATAAGICLVLCVPLRLLLSAAAHSAPATPVPACTDVRAPQPVPTPTRPAWAGEEPAVSLEPDLEAALDPMVPQYLDHAIARFAACWNTGDWSTVVRGATPRFRTTALGVPPDPAALADLGLGPITILAISEPRLWSDRRVAAEVLYQRGPQVVAERWFFRVTHGDALMDEAMPLALPPLGDRLVLGVETVGFTAPWAWRGVQPEVVPPMSLVVIAVANRTPQPRSITVRDADRSVAGFLSVPGGSEVELGLRDLPPGTYEIASAESTATEPMQFQIGEEGE